MKVIGIAGSPRVKNSYTLRLVQAGIDGAAHAGADVEAIDITRFRINYCKGCGNCYRKGVCFQDDDFPYILSNVINADGIILGSPDYIDSVTAQMKTLMDRMDDARHCQLFHGKYGFSISTTGGNSGGLVTRYMNSFLTGCGVTVTGAVDAAIGGGPLSINTALEKSYQLGKDLVDAIREKRSYPDQDVIHMAFRESFRPIIEANKERWVHDYLHWVQKGWI